MKSLENHDEHSRGKTDVTEHSAKHSMNRQPQCDPAAAIGRLAGYVDVYGSLVSNLISDRTGSLGQLQVAVECGDATGTSQAAHALKGLALTCGANCVAAAAADLERMGRSGQMGHASSALTTLTLAMAIAREELAPYCRDGDTLTG